VNDQLIPFRTATQLVKKFPSFYGNRSFIITFTTDRHCFFALLIKKSANFYTSETIVPNSSLFCIIVISRLVNFCTVYVWKNIDFISNFTHSSSWLTNSLTPWSKILLGKLRVTQLVKKFPAFYGTRRSITVSIRAGDLERYKTLST